MTDLPSDGAPSAFSIPTSSAPATGPVPDGAPSDSAFVVLPADAPPPAKGLPPKKSVPRRDKSLSALSNELIQRYGTDGTIIDLDEVQVGQRARAAGLSRS